MTDAPESDSNWRAVWEASAEALVPPADEAKAAQAWADFRARFPLAEAVGAPTDHPMPLRPMHPPTSRRRITPGIVAGLTVGICLLLAFGVGHVLTRSWSVLPSVSSNEQVYATTVGERAQVTLADGTQIALAPESRLHVPMGYGSGRRAVQLEGEGYFKVVHNAQAPFTVRTANVDVQDIGTAFDVRSYVSDPVERIAVASGEVAITAHRHASVAPSVRPGDLAIVSDTGIAVMHDAAEPSLSWTRGELTFTALPVGQVVAELGRWYGVRITFSDPALARVPVTATFDVERHGDDAFLTLAQLLHLQYVHVGTTITFSRTAQR